MPTQRDLPKCATACFLCRARKVKCNGGKPCTNCAKDHEAECTYPVPQKRISRLARERQLLERNKELERQVLRVTSELRTVTTTGPEVAMMGHRYGREAPAALNLGYLSSPETSQDRGNPNSAITTELAGEVQDSIDNDILRRIPPSNLTTQSVLGVLSPQSIASNEESVVSPQHSNSEYHGPTSYLSICSKPAVEWISKRTGCDFRDSAKGMALSITGTLKLDSLRQHEKGPDLDMETAFRYSRAFFDESPDTIYHIIDRSMFERRLNAHFASGAGQQNDCPAWYALRNIIYAYGCRIEISKTSHRQRIAESQTKAWAYFENALSVHTELMYTRTDMSAVQALTAMAFFVDGLGSPKLEQMLVRNAAELAQAKGLHLQVPETWNLDRTDKQERSYLFWAIYCLEKNLSQRSGRSSVIDDDDISCNVPETHDETTADDLQLLGNIIKHAQISSEISKRLATVKGLRQPLNDMIKTVQDLEERLHSWKESISDSIRPGTDIKPQFLAVGTSLEYVLYLQFAYYGSLIATHSVFFYPWNLSRFSVSSQSTLLANQIALSSEVVAEASRNIILKTKQIQADASSPICLAVYYPLVGLINLFIYVIKYPTSPSAESDITLLEVAVGHFSYLSFILGSSAIFNFIKDFVSQARLAVREAKEIQPYNQQYISGSITSVEEPQTSRLSHSFSFDDTLDMVDFNMDDWPSLPSFSSTV